MIIFGEEVKQNLDPEKLENIFSLAKEKSQELRNIKIDQILDTLDATGKLWSRESQYYKNALKLLSQELSFSEDMIAFTLDLIPELLSKNNLKKRLNLELENLAMLDDFVYRPEYQSEHGYFTLGSLVHISAGNVFLGCIDSLLMGFLTKNINILKTSSKNNIFPKLFAESLAEADTQKILSDKYCICYWKGGDPKLEQIVKKRAGGIICWGGGDAIKSWRSGLGSGVKLFEYGPKISFQLLTQKGLNAVSDRVRLMNSFAQDICLWDQAACASAQVIYVEKGVDLQVFMTELALALGNFPLARGEVSQDEQVELLKYTYRCDYQSLETGLPAIRGGSFNIIFDPISELSVSPLNRSIVVKTFEGPLELASAISPYRSHLQTCAIQVGPSEINIYSELLADIGITRIVQPGEMLRAKVGAPHDGKFGLRELVTVVSRELIQHDIEKFCQEIAERIPFYHKYSGMEFKKWPIIDGKEIYAHGPGSANPTMIDCSSGGSFFASGGTTGASKYSFYTNEEFNQICAMLANSYMDVGLTPGSVVANMFVAANMWSSFTAVSKALELCSVKVLPIGGQCEMKYIIEFFNRFNPTVIFGIPSMLVEMSKVIKANIETIFYAGEVMTKAHQKLLRKNWGVKKFSSAGYASVDVGPIGYQVPEGEPGENYLFDGIHLEVIDGIAVVTSTLRRSMPIIRYNTGDKVEIIGTVPRVKFKLHGRGDETIFIWSARIPLIDIRRAFDVLNLEAPEQIQVVFCEKNNRDRLIFVGDYSDPFNLEAILWNLFSSCEDLQQTLSFEALVQNTQIRPSHCKVTNPRTGKVPAIVDERC